MATSAAKDRAGTLGAELQAKIASGGLSQDQIAALKQAIAPDAFTHGAGAAYLVGSAIMIGAAAIIYLALQIRHRDLAADNAGAAMMH